MTYSADFQIDLGSALSGLALTATITTMAGAALASGVSGWTEYPAASGVYWGTYSSFADGVSYRVIWLNGSTLVSSTTVSPSDARVQASVDVDEAAIAATVSAAVTAAVNSGAIASALAAYLSGAPITITSPVAASGDVEIVRGDDYSALDGRALEWTNAAGTWPDLTGATITFTAKASGSTTFTAPGSVVVATGAGQKVRVQLSAAQTNLAVNSRIFDVQATLSPSGRRITLLFGTLTIKQDITT